MDHNAITLYAADYIVTVIMLCVPLAIGGFFAVRDWKNATRDEYLLGGRQMSMIPVALSLFVTFQSAISLMGIPADVYSYGGVYAFLYIGIASSYIVGLFSVVPVLYPLHLTSIYEYLELRFESKAVRILSTLLGMFSSTCYMAVVQLAPALALQAAAGIPLWMSIVIVGLIGTIYTAMGGIKSVVWTDAFQCAIMFAGIVTVVVKGSSVVGGFGEAMQTARDNGRLTFDRITIDPRERHTVWSTLLGGLFMWLSNAMNQANLQRISAMKTLKDAKVSYILNVPLTLFYGGSLLILGCVSFSYFYHIQCDPFQSGIIESRNQMLPYFVMHSLQDLPGMAGFFMATLFSGSLSSLSSGINALAANTVEDFLKRPLEKYSEKTATWITKGIVIIYGTVTVVLAYLANFLKGPITQLALSVFGAWGGPVLGIFSIGAMVPWINKYGALIGGSVTIIFNSWMAVGNQIAGKKNRMLPPPPSDKCFANVSSVLFEDANSTTTAWTTMMSRENSTFVFEVQNSTAPTHDPYANGFFIYDISYEWYGVIGFVMSCSLAMIVSLLTQRWCKSKPNPKLILPSLRKFWNLEDTHYTPADEYNAIAVYNLSMSQEKLEDFKGRVLKQELPVSEPVILKDYKIKELSKRV